MTRLLLTLLTLIMTFQMQAQRPGGPPGGRGNWGDGGPPKIDIKGKVLDATTGAPLEFANVAIFSKRDSSVLGGGLTGADGTFTVKSRPGKLYAVVEFLGYEKFVVDPVPFDRDKMRAGERSVNLGEIRLGDSGIDLSEVEVRAEKSETQFSLDKRIFNVGKDLANQGGTAEDILDNVPSLSVDVEGQVSLRGNTGVRVLIDGKPSGMATSNNLKQIPANMIDQIEVITNPSARYEAEGTSGIINIILKKEKRSGFNGSFDVTGGYPARAGVGANLNYRKGKINWFLNYGLNYRTGPGSGFQYQEANRTSGLFISEQTRDMDRGGLRNNIRGGIDYYLTDKDVFTGSLMYRISDERNTYKLTYDDYQDSRANLVSSSTRTDNEIEEESGLQYSLNYRKEFSNRFHTLNISADYQDDLEKESSDLQQNTLVFTDSAQIVPPQRSANSEGQRRWQFRADYNHAFNKDHKIELGLNSSLRDIDNDYTVEEFREGLWTSEIRGFIPGQSISFNNGFRYDEDIHAAYAQYGNKYGAFSYLAGLRLEHSIVKTELLLSEYSNPRNYTNLFPSLFLSYEIGEGNAIQTSYSRRVRRPRFWDLNPFFTFSDNRNLFAGNPDLDPEFTDAYEVSYLKIWDKATLSSGIFYRHTEDAITRIREVISLGDETTPPVTRFTSKNLATQDEMGLEFTLSYKGLDWLNLNTDLNFFRSVTEGVINAGELNEQQLDAETFTWRARGTARFKFWDSDLQARFNYRAPRISVQGSYKSIASLDLGWSKDFLKSKNMTITISVRDLFNSRKRRYETIIEDFYQEGEFQWRARSSSITLSYRINQKKRRGRPGGGSYQGGDEGGF